VADDAGGVDEVWGLGERHDWKDGRMIGIVLGFLISVDEERLYSCDAIVIRSSRLTLFIYQTSSGVKLDHQQNSGVLNPTCIPRPL
jgi:hypothetical protein